MAVDMRIDTAMRLIGQYDADTTVDDDSPYGADRLSRIASGVVFQPGGMVKTGASVMCPSSAVVRAIRCKGRR